MRTIVVVACLGLLLWIEPAASEQRMPTLTYTVRIRAHESISGLTPENIKRVLARASQPLSKCNVTFKLDETRPVTRPQMKKRIRNEADLEAVHQVTACGSTPNCVD